jgi:hypothetical protein
MLMQNRTEFMQKLHCQAAVARALESLIWNSCRKPGGLPGRRWKRNNSIKIRNLLLSTDITYRIMCHAFPKSRHQLCEEGCLLSPRKPRLREDGVPLTCGWRQLGSRSPPPILAVPPTLPIHTLHPALGEGKSLEMPRDVCLLSGGYQYDDPYYVTDIANCFAKCRQQGNHSCDVGRLQR